MTEKHDQDAIVSQVKAALDDSTANMDAATLSKLNRARQHAIAEATSRPAVPTWLPAAAVTASLVIVVGLWSGLPTDDAAIDAMPAALLSDTLVLDDADIDLLQELEFYAWLIEQENAG